MSEPKICDVGPGLDVVVRAHAGNGQLARVRLDNGAEEAVGSGRWQAYLGRGAQLAQRPGLAIDAVMTKTSAAGTGNVTVTVEQRLPVVGSVEGEGPLIHEESWTNEITFVDAEAKHSTTIVFAV